MSKRKLLYQTQRAVLKDLFYSNMDEENVLNKHRVMRSTFNHWLEDEVFAEQFRLCMRGIIRQNDLAVVKNGGSAARKLAGLMECDKPEVARKACVDIMAMSRRLPQPAVSEKEHQGTIPKQVEQLSPENASRILAILAGKEDRK